MDAGRCLILTGPPGSGKSTVAPVVALRYGRAVCLESDWFWTTIRRGFVPPDREEAHQQNGTVVDAFAAAASRMAAGGYTVVLDGIVGPWFLPEVLSEFARDGVPCSYAVLRPAPEVAMARALGRAGEERTVGHPALADPDVVARMWQAFADLGPFEGHVVDSEGLDATATADRVGTLFDRGDLLLDGV